MKKLLLSVPLLFLFTSCVTGPMEGPLTPQTEQVPETGNYAGSMVEAVRIIDPYSVENIMKLMEDEGMTRSGGSIVTPAVTHYHVRFKPTTDEQCDIIKNDETIDIQPYPFDVEVPLGAVSYVDYDQPVNTPAFIFAIVRKNYSFPQGVAYDILGSLCNLESSAPAIANTLDLGTPSIDPINPPRGMFECHTEASDIVGGSSGSTSGPFKPSGTIKVWDNLLEAYIPLAGVKVKAKRNALSSVIMTTDANGRFSTTKTYEGKVTYSIIWETGSYDIRDGKFGQAFYSGPTKKEPWNLKIDNSDSYKKTAHIASIHRAAYRYYYGNVGGLLAGVKHTGNKKIKISYMNETGASVFQSGHTVIPGIFPDIKIFKRRTGDTKDRTISEIYAATSHELGHLVHCLRMGNLSYWQVKKYIRESWADFVQWHLLKLEYEERSASLGFNDANKFRILQNIINNDEYSCQYWPYYDRNGKTESNTDYSPIFIDLVDDYNQQVANERNYGINSHCVYPNDQVSKYTAATLNEIVLRTYNVSGLKSAVKNQKPSNVTNVEIDNLFLRYEEIW